MSAVQMTVPAQRQPLAPRKPQAQVVPATRNGRTGWAVEWSTPQELLLVSGFYNTREEAEAAIQRL